MRDCKLCRKELNKDNSFSWANQSFNFCKECYKVYHNQQAFRGKILKLLYKFKNIEDVECQNCRCKNVVVLDFHHVEDKTFSIQKLIKLTDKVKKELDKCIVICSNCHLQKHSNEYKEQRLEKGNKTTESINGKQCSKCRKFLDTKDFGIRKERKNLLRSECKYCFRERVSNREIKIKEACINIKGSKCQHCNKEYHYASMVFHHEDPCVKDFTIGDKRGHSIDNLKLELDKCILLCSNCHRIEHLTVSKEYIQQLLQELKHKPCTDSQEIEGKALQKL